MLIAFFGIYTAPLVLPVAILAAAFVYARLHREGPLDLISGVTAYLSIMIAVSAVLVALGAGHLLTGIVADLNQGYTYGPDEVFGSISSGFDSSAANHRQDADLAGGLGFALVGVAIANLHVWLRGRLVQSGDLDLGVEHAVEILVALLLGLVTLVLAAVAVGRAVERISYGSDAGAPGEFIAFALAFAAVWLIYGARSLIALSAPSDAEAATGESSS